jgi:hypothetical protein
MATAHVAIANMAGALMRRVSVALLPFCIVACALSTDGTDSGQRGGTGATGGGIATGGTSGAGGAAGRTTAGGGGSSSGSGGSTAGSGGSAGQSGGAAGRGGVGSAGEAGAGGTPDGGGRAGQSGAGQGGGGQGGGGQGGGGATAGGASGASGARDGGGAAGSAGASREGGTDSVTDAPSLDSGSSGFRPCPTNGDPCKILPLGDSITWGIQYDGAYRVELFNRAVAAGQKITFTGSLSNGPDNVAGMPFPKNNEGHSGWTIAQVTGLVPTPAFGTVPHVVLLMIGTNDIYASSGQSTMPDRLGALIDKIVVAAPDALLVVAKITPLSNMSWNQTIATYNNAIPGILQPRAAAGKHVMLADMNTGFTSSMLSSDAIDPNKSGYDFMAGVWYTAISIVLPK